MSIFFISGGEKKKVRHHKDVKMLQGVSYVIPKEMTGCPDQRFAFSKQKSIRFIKRNTVIDLELNTNCAPHCLSIFLKIDKSNNSQNSMFLIL